ncbi:MAG TPA: PilW family protein, partial [Vicinamibacterales bacterium]|nr:PilW family protein [Vicinamibacterales bacterium]
MRNQNRNLLGGARARGVSLIELLVAVTIGGLLIFGATKVYVDSRATYEVNETAARLQETARYALSVLEPDIRMSNYWGFVKGAGVVINQAAQTAPPVVGVAQDCGNNYAHDLQRNLEANNNAYAIGCAAFGTGAVVSSDTLTVRRASNTISSGAATGRLRVCSTRIFASLVTDMSGCTLGPSGQVNDLVVNAYYVDRDSTHRAGIPALRRHALIAGPAFNSEEIIPGIEDMQVQFGIDPSGTGGSAQRYVDPSVIPSGAQIVSVRIWLLVRAENPEVGFRDNRTYQYADRATTTGTTADLNAANAAGRAYAPADGFR